MIDGCSSILDHPCICAVYVSGYSTCVMFAFSIHASNFNVCSPSYNVSALTQGIGKEGVLHKEGAKKVEWKSRYFRVMENCVDYFDNALDADVHTLYSSALPLHSL